MESIGVVGLGLLGSAIAERLLRAGFGVVGYDPDPAATERLRAIDGKTSVSVQQLAQECRRFVFSLPGPAQVSDTVDRLERSLTPGTMILDTTTGDPEAVESIAARLEISGVTYLDCEVGGSSKQLAAGEAMLLCGGEFSAFSSCQDLLEALGSRVFHTGSAGTGTRMKLALNICIGLHRAVLAESLTFAEANGIDPVAALEILKAGPGYSRVMDVKGNRMLTRNFADPDARLAQHLKDVRLILKAGDRLDTAVPLSRLHELLLSRAVDLGFGAEDNSAILKVFARENALGERID